MIEFENPSNQDLDLVKKLIENHFTYTSSKIAEKSFNITGKKSQKTLLK